MINCGCVTIASPNVSSKVRLGHKMRGWNRLYFGHNPQNVAVIFDKVSKFRDDRISFTEKVGTESMKNL